MRVSYQRQRQVLRFVDDNNGEGVGSKRVEELREQVAEFGPRGLAQRSGGEILIDRTPKSINSIFSKSSRETNGSGTNEL